MEKVRPYWKSASFWFGIEIGCGGGRVIAIITWIYTSPPSPRNWPGWGTATTWTTFRRSLGIYNKGGKRQRQIHGYFLRLCVHNFLAMDMVETQDLNFLSRWLESQYLAQTAFPWRLTQKYRMWFGFTVASNCTLDNVQKWKHFPSQTGLVKKTAPVKLRQSNIPSRHISPSSCCHTTIRNGCVGLKDAKLVLSGKPPQSKWFGPENRPNWFVEPYASSELMDMSWESEALSAKWFTRNQYSGSEHSWRGKQV